MLIKLILLGVTAEVLRTNIGSKSVILLQRGPVDRKLQVEGVAPQQPFFNLCDSSATTLLPSRTLIGPTGPSSKVAVFAQPLNRLIACNQGQTWTHTQLKGVSEGMVLNDDLHPPSHRELH